MQQLSNVEVTNINKPKYPKAGMAYAELKQTTKKVYYNSAQISDLFKEEQTIKERDEVRVTWILIPENKTKKEVQERLNRYPNIRIKKVLSNNPILEENQIISQIKCKHL